MHRRSWVWRTGVVLCILMAGPAWADRRSGPSRTTLMETDWGTVYYVPRTFTNLVVANTGPALSLKTPEHEFLVQRMVDGRIEVREGPRLRMKVEVGIGWYAFETPGHHLRLAFSEADLVLTYDGRKLVISRTTPIMTIRGPEGTTKLTIDAFGTTIESPRGKTVIHKDGIQGVAREGVSVGAHPHLGRGVWVEWQGIGFFVDLWKFESRIGVDGELEWDSVF